MSSNPPKIAILGAGPAGLTLASLLSTASSPISFTIFELRPRPSPSDINTPSGSLDLHKDSGLLALGAGGLLENFARLKSECSQELRLSDKFGSVQYQKAGHGSRPEIERNALTQLLLESVPETKIRWEHKVLSVAQSALTNEKWKLSFNVDEKTQEEEFDLIIGADGAWSRVRPLLTSIQPFFCGINCITLTIPRLTTRHPHLASLMGNGSYFACGEGKCIVAQRGLLDSARIYLMIKSPSSHPNPESWLSDSGISSMSPSMLKNELLTSSELFSTWGKELKELISTGCDAESSSSQPISAQPLYMLPPGHNWTHVPGLTLIGDAAHLMPPFSGEGANAAMLDALELSQAIIKSQASTFDAAVNEYEHAMFPRAKNIMEKTFQNMEMMFTEDSPREVVKFMKSRGPLPEK